MMKRFADAERQPTGAAARHGRAGPPSTAIPELVSEVYRSAPAPLRTQLLECLLAPVGPLAIVTISAGAFAHLLYRLRLHGVPVTLDDAANVKPDNVFELARYVAQASPDTIQRIGALISSSPIAVATVAGTALLAALGAWRRLARDSAWREGDPRDGRGAARRRDAPLAPASP
jgi:hypothetical protein